MHSNNCLEDKMNEWMCLVLYKYIFTHQSYTWKRFWPTLLQYVPNCEPAWPSATPASCWGWLYQKGRSWRHCWWSGSSSDHCPRGRSRPETPGNLKRKISWDHFWQSSQKTQNNCDYKLLQFHCCPCYLWRILSIYLYLSIYLSLKSYGEFQQPTYQGSCWRTVSQWPCGAQWYGNPSVCRSALWQRTCTSWSGQTGGSQSRAASEGEDRKQ